MTLEHRNGADQGRNFILTFNPKELEERYKPEAKKIRGRSTPVEIEDAKLKESRTTRVNEHGYRHLHRFYLQK